MWYSRHQLLILVLGAGMASALPAQGRRAPDRQGAGTAGRMADRPGMDSARLAAAMARRADGGGSPAALILLQRQRLGLTDDQVNRLETLKTSFAANTTEPAELAQLREDLAVASRGEANIEAARTAMARINALTTSALVVRLEAHNQARAVLNGDQQVQFDALQARRPAMGRGVGLGGADGAGVRGRGGRGGTAAAGTRKPPLSVPQ